MSTLNGEDYFNIYLFIYQLFWTQACTEGMCMNGTQVPCEVPSLPNPTTSKGWPHHWGLQALLFLNSDVGSFMSHKNKSAKVLWDGTYSFLSLSKKTRKSNHLQMSLQRQHFLLSYYFKDNPMPEHTKPTSIWPEPQTLKAIGTKKNLTSLVATNTSVRSIYRRDIISFLHPISTRSVTACKTQEFPPLFI